jgi:hypothetical protein
MTSFPVSCVIVAFAALLAASAPSQISFVASSSTISCQRMASSSVHPSIGMACPPRQRAFFDRTFCYYAASYPRAAEVMQGMSGKRIGLVLASEETYPGASLGIVHQIQEFSCYTHSEFVGVVRGIGNNRSEVTRDPGDPMLAAEQLGREIFSRKHSDYRIDTQRSGRVWPSKPVNQ